MRASMDNSPRHRDDAHKSPSSSTTPTRSVRSTNQYQTTFIHTDTSSFKQVVQMLTGISKNPTRQPDPRSSSSSHSIPPIKGVPNKKQSSSFRLYERRKSMKHALEINPTHSGLPEIFSPSTLDFTALALSPVTPLTPDPFDGAGSSSQSLSNPKPNSDAEERAIKEKGFYLHPSPSTTPRDSEPRLLPLFPVTSILSPPSPHQP